jgi:hypothetical protein
MSEIKVKDLSSLNISGADLFDDAENFLIELNDETTTIVGGMPCIQSNRERCNGTCVFFTYIAVTSYWCD